MIDPSPALDHEDLDAQLREAVDRFNTAADPQERIEAHQEIRTLRRRLGISRPEGNQNRRRR